MDAVTAAEATATDAARRKEAATQALREASERTPALEQDYLDWKLAVGMTLDPHKPPSQSQAELEEQIRALQAKMQKLQAEWAVRAMSPSDGFPRTPVSSTSGCAFRRATVAPTAALMPKRGRGRSSTPTTRP